MQVKTALFTLLMIVVCLPVWAGPTASDVIKASGVQGGLVVHLGCGDGQFTAALRADDRYVVHGLDGNQKNVDQARAYLQSKGLYGAVSVEWLRTTALPYSDNLVNLLVVSAAFGVSQREMHRVLAPGGVLMSLRPTADRLQPFKKPRPSDIDEWTHFLHDASGNAVAKDDRVGPPRHLQWMAEPKRTRDHDALASFTTMTSSNGRIFYILDEGPTSQIHRQPQWRLIARDAFNGIPLWKRKIESWVTHLYNFRAGPVHMTRRLVSVGDRVYVTLGFDAPISALDAATGKTVSTYDGSRNTEEIVLQDGVLLSVQGDPKLFNAEATTIDGYWEMRREGTPTVVKSITAYQASSGEVLWKRSQPGMAYLVPLSLTAASDNVFYLDRESLHCLNRQTGEPQWSAPYPSEGLFLRNYAPTVVVSDDVIVCLSFDKMAAFSVKDGRELWKKDQGYLGFGSPGDLFVVNGLVWTFPGTAGIRYESKDRILGNRGKEFWALDLHSGEIKRTINKADVWPGGHHHRCYRNKATENFAVCGRRGLEFVDLTGGDRNVINWWVRGICQYGVMPCNGMVYVPPDPCQCFSTIKLDGLLALVADNSLDQSTGQAPPPLEKGPAYGRVSADGTSTASAANEDDWPTYRHDMMRSGASVSTVPSQIEQKWARNLGGQLSGVVVADHRLFVSAVDQNTVHCLKADSGEPIWQFVAGAAVDSPPTIAHGLALFGSRDGRVYAVDASNGQLAWSYRAGPCDRRVVGKGRLESVWPIDGSVLVLDGVVYFAAGRSSFLDGGIRLYGLDVKTGEKRYETLVNSQPADNNNTGALSDILASDGTDVEMRQLSFDRQLQQNSGRSRGSFSARTGFLEDEWGHRLTWRMGQASANLLVFNDTHVYGAVSRYTGWKKNKNNWPPTHTGHLHQKYSRYKPEWFPIGNRLFGQSRSGAKQARRGDSTSAAQQWAINAPIQVRSLVLAGEVLLAAGWPDAVTVMGQAPETAAERELQHPKLWTLSPQDGQTLSERDLPDLPVFDGAAVAYHRIFMTLQNGQVVCFGQ